MTKKILFTNAVPIIERGMAPGFRKNGWEVMILSPQYYTVEGLSQIIDSFKPDYLFTEGGIGSRDWVVPVVKAKGIPHIYWAIEDPIFTDSLGKEWAEASLLTLTPCIEKVEKYEELGYPCLCVPFAVDSDDYYHRPHDGKFGAYDAVLIANNYSYYYTRHKAYMNVLDPLIDKYTVGVFGQGWTDKEKPYNIPDNIERGYLSHTESLQAYSESKIVLGVHSVTTSDTMQSMRTFEVLGCRGFFLSSYAKSLESMFMNHVHLVYSSSPEETLEITKFYINNGTARGTVAHNGYEFVHNHHTYTQRAFSIIKELELL